MTVGILGFILASSVTPTLAQDARLTKVSEAADGTSANGASYNGTISGDGAWVAFASDATNLVANDTNGRTDVFIKHLATGVVTRVSVTSTGAQAGDVSGTDGLDVSANGEVIVFTSSAALVPGDTNTCLLESGATGPCPDIYVRDLAANSTTRVSVPSGGGSQATGRSRHPRVSDDGRYVVFASLAADLVPGDSNDLEDVFVHDRQTGTTTRVSVTSTGAQIDGAAFAPAISGDGSAIAFLSAAPILRSPTDPTPCPAVSTPCTRGYVHHRSIGTTVLVAAPSSLPLRTGGIVRRVVLDGEGRFVALGLLQPPNFPNDPSVHLASLYDARLQRTVRVLTPVWHAPGLFNQDRGQGVGVSGNGAVFIGGGGFRTQFTDQFVTTFGRLDRRTGLFGDSSLHHASPTSALWFEEVELSTNGHRMAFTTVRALAADDSGEVSDVYIFNRDVDEDHMADDWEGTFGLNAGQPNDAALDQDNDGKTNRQEYEAGSHPANRHTAYFPEGASNAFFHTRIAVFHTDTTPTVVLLRFLASDGTTASELRTIAGPRRVTIDLGAGSNVPGHDFSTIVESSFFVVADRTMTWDSSGYGSHAEAAIDAPALNWFLAEGATHGGFDLFYLLQNPNETETVATITYLRPSPQPPIHRVYTLAPRSRRTIWVDTEEAALAATDVSAQITATQPIIVERAMYATFAGQPSFAAGHEGAGVTAPATSWFLAEGATGSFFDLFVLIANPGQTDATVTVTYLRPDGAPPITKAYTVDKLSRRTISVDGEDASLVATSVAMKVDSTQPVVVERAMWWPSPNWYEGHLTRGATTTGTAWALAEGDVSGTTETYILIANPGDTAGTATVTLWHEGVVGGPATSQVEVPLSANSRVTIPVSVAFAGVGFSPSRRFGTHVSSNGIPIVVERAMYTSTDGVTWSAGTAALATKLR